MLRAAREVEKSGPSQHGVIVKTLRKEHHQAAECLIRSEEILKELNKDIEDDCKDLELFLDAANVSCPQQICSGEHGD